MISCGTLVFDNLGINIAFHALTFARSRGRSVRFSTPRDLANVKNDIIFLQRVTRGCTFPFISVFLGQAIFKSAK